MIALSGPLLLARCADGLAQSDALLAGAAREIVVDLSQTGAADSAGVALLLELKRRAARRGRALTFRGAPAQLRALAAFFGVAEILSLA